MKTAELTELLNQIKEAVEENEACVDQYYDIRAEYMGEVNRYGDAWVGANDQLNRAWEHVTESEAELNALKAKLPPKQGCELPPIQSCDEEDPF